MSITLSNSQLQMWMHSPACFWWRYVVGLSSAITPDYLTWGSAVHRGLELLYEGGRQLDDVIQLMREEGSLDGLMRLAEDGNFHTPEALREVLDRYIDTYSEDLLRYKIVATEGEVTTPINSTVSWLGKHDLILREKETENVYILDHKTTGKKVTSSYYTDPFSHDDQMTSYWWQGQEKYGDAFDGILINAIQTTTTIPYRHARFALVRDQWQLDEWRQRVMALGPVIANALEVGKQMHEAGLTLDDEEVVHHFPFHNTYSENFCDYKTLNRSPPGLRPQIIEHEYKARTVRGGDEDDDA